MDQAHKQRLVGGIVLVALGLILIPTILDFSQEASDPMAGVEIPESPDVMKMEVLPLEVWSERIDPEIDSANRIVETPAAPQQPAQQSATDKAEPAKSQQQAPIPKKVAEAEPKPQTATKTDIPEGATAWVVQIASFSDESKAFRLRDKLRKLGHPAFIERGRKSGQLTYRVKVGPVLQRSKADSLKKQVAKQTKLDGLVMQYR